MTGKTDLRTIFATMEPKLSEIDYAFGTIPDAALVVGIGDVIATFAEEEGLSVVAPTNMFAEAGVAHSPGWARISLSIHSSLAAVGLTAALATALADEGISANVVAAYFHDHIFVPWEQRHCALDILLGLARTSNEP